MYDVCIIGGGVVGCAIARELARYKLRTVLCEKSVDVSNGATKANSAIVHGGYTATHGTVKGELSIRGNRMFDRLNEELNFGLNRCGSLVLAFSNEERSSLETLLQNGKLNGVKGLRIVEREELEKMEPEVGPEAVAALHCPETAVTSPYEMCIALAENAVTNGLDLRLESEVVGIEKTDGAFTVQIAPQNTSENTPQKLSARYVVNAAGVYSDRIAAMVGDTSFRILPRQGQYLILRRGDGKLINSVIFQTPTKRGKGILVTPTYWGNLMIGPNSEEIPEREDVSTNSEILAYIVEKARRSVPGFKLSHVIRSFSGIRATSDSKEFIIEEAPIGGFIHAAGIDSPGLTSSPAIAVKVLKLLETSGLTLEEKADFNPKRPGINSPHPLQPIKEVQDLIDLPEGNPERIVCRCEQVREKTILDALQRGIPIKSLDAVKRRTRAGMGSCQGTFCGPRVRTLIAHTTDISEEEVLPRSGGSGVLPERVSGKDLRSLEEQEKDLKREQQ
ncbi:MAG: NAD(P)/FAD-dependent oxidoreductase [Spirochaetaceae bacterium]|nr:NAD(P)/FAD-dependent oxidoreductase [Spirochaetaceae bacterium]MCF7947772.1 NAD(P)/FAD-dependent oxidoreductase [Spirochaetia bacterium]MCF7950635.1 NAD(P)/FAD-dependent oxidoreductase [Spirochaetaceae bacterium]